ncbi:hypothetical protein F3Y22_tig00110556pilonHSYRG00770 [Hibiscus syriacus]|uniref:Uncharacterized protein n=1 Tax=Hibiscus syriacus TaxID=106335 RepID=A0A6A3AC93_HIBSY|nr:hypothetical protein F3Y22_tig00110556pilonHSYRG00770 [Hibiscus syriacus]
MFKAVRKLEFWSKKRKSIAPRPSSSFAPSYCHSCYSSASVHSFHYYQSSYLSSSMQPSAPPLPPWLQDEFPTPEKVEPFPEFSSPAQHPTQDIESDLMFTPASPSCQQYMDPNPVYGLPLVQQKVEERYQVGFNGCVTDFSLHLFRCLCPCFHIREVHERIMKPSNVLLSQ